MTIHAMFVYNKKILIDKILYDDIFNYLDDQARCLFQCGYIV